MKTLTRTLLALAIVYIAVACTVGTQVVMNGQPTAWGSCIK